MKSGGAINIWSISSLYILFLSTDRYDPRRETRDDKKEEEKEEAERSKRSPRVNSLDPEKEKKCIQSHTILYHPIAYHTIVYIDRKLCPVSRHRFRDSLDRFRDFVLTSDK